LAGPGFSKERGQAYYDRGQPGPSEGSSGTFRKAVLHKVIDLRVNDAFKAIPLPTGSFDFVFIDESKFDSMAFFDFVYPRFPQMGPSQLTT
jgi:hypothetical protein